MLGRVSEVQAPHDGSRHFRLERFVEGPFGMRVQVVAHQNDFVGCRVTRA